MLQRQAGRMDGRGACRRRRSCITSARARRRSATRSLMSLMDTRLRFYRKNRGLPTALVVSLVYAAGCLKQMRREPHKSKVKLSGRPAVVAGPDGPARRQPAAALSAAMRILFVVPYVPSRVRVRPVRAHPHAGHAQPLVHVVALRPPEDRWASGRTTAWRRDQVDDVPAGSRRARLSTRPGALAGRQPLQAAYSRPPGGSAAPGRRWSAAAASTCCTSSTSGVSRWSGGSPASRSCSTPSTPSRTCSSRRRGSPRGWRQRLIARLDLRRTERFEARAPRICSSGRSSRRRLTGTRSTRLAGREATRARRGRAERRRLAVL